MEPALAVVEHLVEIQTGRNIRQRDTLARIAAALHANIKHIAPDFRGHQFKHQNAAGRNLRHSPAIILNASDQPSRTRRAGAITTALFSTLISTLPSKPHCSRMDLGIHTPKTAHCSDEHRRLDHRNHPALRYCQRIRGFAAPIGRRARFRLIRAMPPPSQGLGMVDRKLHRLGQHRQHPGHRTKAGIPLSRLMNF